MKKVERVGIAPVTPLVAQRLWTDTNRWPTFIDGFGHVEEQSDDWPAVGSKVIWESGPAGRGRVTERIRVSEDGVVETQVFDEQMRAFQTARFVAAADGCEVYLALDYELAKPGPFSIVTDALFIRRALAMALERTLRRFSTEAADEAAV
jgi:hypothetical protein